jgi:hypothetical protein
MISEESKKVDVCDLIFNILTSWDESMNRGEI